MPARDRSKRKYGFGDLTAPTKFETLEFVEKTKEMSSAKLADLMKISLNHAARLLRGYWTEGLLHRELSTKRHGGIRYFFRLTPGFLFVETRSSRISRWVGLRS